MFAYQGVTIYSKIAELFFWLVNYDETHPDIE